MAHIGLVRATAAAVRALWQRADDVTAASLLAERGAAADLPAAELAELSSAVDQIRREFAAVRRREAELQRLVQAAQHLLASPAPQDLLTIIVEATRDLVHSDAAHLNLKIGDDFDTIRTTTGARTEAFRRQRTPHGAGLTGLVMRSREPYVTPDYVNDPRLDHHPTSDSSVSADGLVTMAAVPMWRGHDIQGVLIASWRSRVTVGPEALDLLTSLSSLAGLAVTNTWLRADADTAHAELEEANRHIRRNGELLEWAGAAHDQLTAVLHEGSPVLGVTRALHELLDAEVVLVDDRGEPISSTPDTAGPPAGYGSGPGAGDGRVRMVETGEPAGDGAEPITTWAADCRSGERTLGTLLVRRLQPMSALEQRTIDRAATTTALILSTRDALAEAEFRSATEALTDLLRGSRVASASSRLRSRGFDTSAPTIVVVAPLTGDRQVVQGTARKHAQERRGLSAVIDDHVVVLLPGTDPDTAAREFADRLGIRGLGAVTGADGPARSPDEIRTVHRRAVRCAEALYRLGGTGVATVSSLGFVGLLLGGDQSTAVEEFVTSRLGPLIGQDTARFGELLHTLRSYLEHNGSLRQAAAALTIHPNTVLQRLQRIEVLLDTDLRAPGVRTELDLALRTYALLGKVRPELPLTHNGESTYVS